MNNFPKYIIDVFGGINTKIDYEEDYNYINDFNSFNNRLDIILRIHIKEYLE